MSSDCSICTLVCPKPDGQQGNEYRVKHLHSIQWDYSDLQQKDGNIDEMLNDARKDFADCEVFNTEDEADAFAEKLDEELQESGMPEYGPTTLALTMPLWASRTERNKA